MTVMMHGTKRRLTAALAGLVVALVCSASDAFAQGGDEWRPGRDEATTSIDGVDSQGAESAVAPPVREGLRQSVASYRERTDLLQREPAQIGQPTQHRPRSKWRAFWGGAIGATAGFFAGGYLGAAIEGDCNGCDDPGLKGALIGAPLGAVIGGIAGALFLF